MEANAKKFQGIWTALITPFDSNGNVDESCYRTLIQRQIEGGVQGIVPVGTTGESPTLTDDEKKKLIQISIEETKGTSVGVIAGTGSNCTRETIEFSKWASDQDVDGLLVVVPYYNKPTQPGLLSHFQSIADAVEKEIVLYNVPARTVVGLEVSTVVELARHPNINCIKEATGDVQYTQSLVGMLEREELHLDILSGDDTTFYPLTQVGAHGCISVVSNALPKEFTELWKASLKGNADSHQERFLPLFKALGIESNPGPIKWVMNRLGLIENQYRLPMVPVAEKSAAHLEQTLQQCGVLK